MGTRRVMRVSYHFISQPPVLPVSWLVVSVDMHTSIYGSFVFVCFFMLLAARSWQTETRQKSSCTLIRSQFAWRCLFCGKFLSLQSEGAKACHLGLWRLVIGRSRVVDGKDVSGRERPLIQVIQQIPWEAWPCSLLSHWSWYHAWRDLVVHPARALARSRCGSSRWSKRRAGRVVRHCDGLTERSRSVIVPSALQSHANKVSNDDVRVCETI